MAVNKLPSAKDLELLRRRMSTQFQIPSAYDDALSYQGLIYKLIQYLKDTMQNVEDWNNWLEPFVQTFDTKLQDTVRERVQELYDTGKLAELTADVIAVVQDQINDLDSKIDDQIDTLDSKIGDQIDDVEETLNNTISTLDSSIITGAQLNTKQVMKKVFDRFGENDEYVYCGFQGMTTTVNNRVLCVTIPISLEHQASTTTGYFVEYDLVTGEELRRVFNPVMGHGNGLAYFNNKVYCAKGGDKDIDVYDYDTLQKIQTITLTDWTSGVYVDEDYIYTHGSGTKFMEIHNHNGQHIRTVTYEYNDSDISTVNQGFTVKDGYVYTVKWKPNMLYVHRLSDGSLVKQYPIPLRSSGLIPNGEVEDISFWGNKLVMLFQHGLQDNYWYMSLVATDIEKGQSDYTDYHWSLEDTSRVIYVNNNYINDDSNGSAEKPFNNIAEAIMVGRSLSLITGASFRISIEATATPYKGVRFNRLDNVYISATGGKAIIENSYIYYSSITFRNIIFDGNNAERALECERSDVFLYDCEFRNYNKAIRISLGSNMNFFGSTATLSENSVVSLAASRFYLNNVHTHEFLQPQGVSSDSRKMRIWKGSDDTGIKTFRNGISSYGWLYFMMSNGDVITIRSNEGTKELRGFNIGATGDVCIMYEIMVSISEDSFNIISKHGFTLSEEGITATTPAFTITEVWAQ